MTDEVKQPVVVGQNEGLLDGIQAAARYITVIVSLGVAVAAFVRVHDYAGLAAYIQSNGGQLIGAISGLLGLVTAAYGIFKTRKRGAQVVALAKDPDVPDTSAHLK